MSVYTAEETRPRRIPVRFRVNGEVREVWVEPRRTLADALRKDLGLTGTKIGCDHGNCGACTVIVDGRAVYSCLTLAASCDGAEIETIEGVGRPDNLHPLQKAFVVHDAFQCGYCTPGQIMSAKALLDRAASEGRRPPDADEVRQALSGNLCRCGAYPRIVEAVVQVARGGDGATRESATAIDGAAGESAAAGGSPGGTDGSPEAPEGGAARA